MNYINILCDAVSTNNCQYFTLSFNSIYHNMYRAKIEFTLVYVQNDGKSDTFLGLLIKTIFLLLAHLPDLCVIRPFKKYILTLIREVFCFTYIDLRAHTHG